MAYRGLRDFIADRVKLAGGPALRFENRKGSAYPVLINTFGSASRMARALGAPTHDPKAATIADLALLGRPSSGRSTSWSVGFAPGTRNRPVLNMFPLWRIE